MTCPDENVILDFVQGRSSPEAASEVGAHLDECDACRAVVAASAKSYDVAWSSSRYKTSSSLDSVRSQRVPPSGPRTDPSLSNIDTEPYVRSPEMLGAGNLLDGRFRLQRVVGRGAMGQIYAAYDERLKLKVAIKVILPELALNRAYLERLHNEIVVARRVSHPNVCRVFDLGKSSGIHFISMELIEGETLEERLERGPLPLRTATDILRQIVTALDAAHRGGVIHRDLKPANIMISAHGHITVMDFGLARDLQNKGSENRKGRSIVGTPAYWSPEQSRGEPATPSSDLYSVGVIACRLFTGTALEDLGEDPLPRVPVAYRDVVRRCLEQDASKRYASADALLLALKIVDRRTPSMAAYLMGAALGAAGLGGVLLIVWGLSPRAPGVRTSTGPGRDSLTPSSSVTASVTPTAASLSAGSSAEGHPATPVGSPVSGWTPAATTSAIGASPTQDAGASVATKTTSPASSGSSRRPATGGRREDGTRLTDPPKRIGVFD